MGFVLLPDGTTLKLDATVIDETPRVPLVGGLLPILAIEGMVTVPVEDTVSCAYVVMTDRMNMIDMNSFFIVICVNNGYFGYTDLFLIRVQKIMPRMRNNGMIMIMLYPHRNSSRRRRGGARMCLCLQAG